MDQAENQHHPKTNTFLWPRLSPNLPAGRMKVPKVIEYAAVNLSNEKRQYLVAANKWFTHQELCPKSNTPKDSPTTRTGAIVVAREARDRICARLTLKTNSFSCQGDITLVALSGSAATDGASSLPSSFIEHAGVSFPLSAEAFSISSSTDGTALMVSALSAWLRPCSRKSSLRVMRLAVEWKSAMEEIDDVGRGRRPCCGTCMAPPMSGDSDIFVADEKARSGVQRWNASNIKGDQAITDIGQLCQRYKSGTMTAEPLWSTSRTCYKLWCVVAASWRNVSAA